MGRCRGAMRVRFSQCGTLARRVRCGKVVVAAGPCPVPAWDRFLMLIPGSLPFGLREVHNYGVQPTSGAQRSGAQWRKEVLRRVARQPPAAADTERSAA